MAEYTYDASSRRRTKALPGPGNSPPSTIIFVYDGWKVLEERDGDGNILAEYTHGLYIDEYVTIETGGKRAYYHQDTIYNVKALTDEKGKVIERYAYTAYGEPSVLNKNGMPVLRSKVGNRHLFQGRRYDQESKLYYFRHRMMSGELGRFLQRDPVGSVGERNRYNVCGDNPLGQVDPDGRRTFTIEIILKHDKWKPTKRVPEPVRHFDKDVVQKKLNEYIAKCDKYLKRDKIQAVIKIVKDPKLFPRKMRYTKYTAAGHTPWYGWVNPIGWAVLPVEAAVTCWRRKPAGLTHHVKLEKWTMGGIAKRVPAYTSERSHQTQVGWKGLLKAYEAKENQIGKNPQWDYVWPNVFAHEVLHVGVLERDWFSVPEGHIASNKPPCDKAPKITKKWCCKFLKRLELE